MPGRNADRISQKKLRYTNSQSGSKDRAGQFAPAVGADYILCLEITGENNMTQESRPVCVVTGGATGIGAAVALRFARGGWAVAIGNFNESTQHSAEALQSECRDLGAPAIVFDADVGVDAQCCAAVARVASEWGRIDALINCAGTTRYVPHTDLHGIDDLEFERVYRVNLIGMYQMTRAATPMLLESSGMEEGRTSSVINVSSIAGLNGRGSSIAYAASKGAVNTMTLSLARSLAPKIRVNALAPGLVDHGLLSHVLDADKYLDVLANMTAAAALKRVSQPSEIAELAWFVTTLAPSMTGQVLVPDNGLLLG
jgi:3-oxoacyl-[acyl-carrier protein] reductase